MSDSYFLRNFAAVNQYFDVMTALQMNAEIFRQLSLIAEDEGKMKRVLKALRRIAEPKPDPTLMSREEFFARVDEAEREIAAGKGKAFASVEQLDQYIRSL